MKLFPAIDLLGGKVVRLTQGRFDCVTDYSVRPEIAAHEFVKAGAGHLHIVDLDGARDGNAKHAQLISDILRNISLEVQVGGGIRTALQARRYLDAGAARVVIGSLAVTSPDAMLELTAAIGPTAIAIAVDFRLDSAGVPKVAIHGWKTESALDPVSLISRYHEHGIKTVLATDVSVDGTLRGPNIELYRQWQEQFPEIEIQVSGGIGSLGHLTALREAGAKAAILGKALYEGNFRLEEALQC